MHPQQNGQSRRVAWFFFISSIANTEKSPYFIFLVNFSRVLIGNKKSQKVCYFLCKQKSNFWIDLLYKWNSLLASFLFVLKTCVQFCLPEFSCRNDRIKRAGKNSNSSLFILDFQLLLYIFSWKRRSLSWTDETKGLSWGECSRIPKILRIDCSSVSAVNEFWLVLLLHRLTLISRFVGIDQTVLGSHLAVAVGQIIWEVLDRCCGCWQVLWQPPVGCWQTADLETTLFVGPNDLLWPNCCPWKPPCF